MDHGYVLKPGEQPGNDVKILKDYADRHWHRQEYDKAQWVATSGSVRSTEHLLEEYAPLTVIHE